MTIPSTNNLLLPLLKKISDNQEHKIGVLIDTLANDLELTEEERELRFPSHEKDRVFNNRVYFAKLNLKNAGLLIPQRRGIIKITPSGKIFLESNPTDLEVKDLRQFEAYKQWKEKIKNKSKVEIKGEQTEISDESPEEAIENAFQTINEELANELLELIKENSPDFFEQLVVDLLLKMGYGGTLRDAGKKMGRSHDGGIDGIIKEDKLGLDFIYIQAKRWELLNHE